MPKILLHFLIRQSKLEYPWTFTFSKSLDKDDSVQSSLQGVSVTLTQKLPVTRGGGEIEGGAQQLAKSVKSVIFLGKMGIEIIVYLYI